MGAVDLHRIVARHQVAAEEPWTMSIRLRAQAQVQEEPAVAIPSEFKGTRAAAAVVVAATCLAAAVVAAGVIQAIQEVTAVSQIVQQAVVVAVVQAVIEAALAEIAAKMVNHVVEEAALAAPLDRREVAVLE